MKETVIFFLIFLTPLYLMSADLYSSRNSVFFEQSFLDFIKGYDLTCFIKKEKTLLAQFKSDQTKVKLVCIFSIINDSIFDLPISIQVHLMLCILIAQIRECVSTGARTHRSQGHHLLHPLILRLLVLCAPTVLRGEHTGIEI